MIEIVWFAPVANQAFGTTTLATHNPVVSEGEHDPVTEVAENETALTVTITDAELVCTLNEESRTCAATLMEAVSLQTPSVVRRTAVNVAAEFEATDVVTEALTGPTEAVTVPDAPIAPSSK